MKTETKCSRWLESYLRERGAVSCEDVRHEAKQNDFTRGELREARYLLSVQTITQSAWMLQRE